VIVGLFQKSFDNVLSMSLLSSHLCSWSVWVAIIVRLCILSYLRMYFPRCRMGPLFEGLFLGIMYLYRWYSHATSFSNGCMGGSKLCG
jgi:hypothetical protein